MQQRLFPIAALWLMLFSATAYSQSLVFSHDNAGNRISREIEQGGGLKSLAISDSVVMDITPEALAGISLYPNPTEGRITLEICGEPDGEFHVVILSLTGAILLNETYNKKRVDLDLRHYPPGNYFLKIRHQNQQKLWKVIKL
jgi:hypothetical protein